MLWGDQALQRSRRFPSSCDHDSYLVMGCVCVLGTAQVLRPGSQTEPSPHPQIASSKVIFTGHLLFFIAITESPASQYYLVMGCMCMLGTAQVLRPGSQTEPSPHSPNFLLQGDFYRPLASLQQLLTTQPHKDLLSEKGM